MGAARLASSVVTFALAKSQLAGDILHLRALRDRLRHTQLIIRAAAAAYIESRWLLAQIERNKTP